MSWQHPGGVGNTAAVDCAKNGEEEEREDDIDTDLKSKPVFRVQVKPFKCLEDFILDEDEAGDQGYGCTHTDEYGQGVEEPSEYWPRDGGGEEPSSSNVQCCVVANLNIFLSLQEAISGVTRKTSPSIISSYTITISHVWWPNSDHHTLIVTSHHPPPAIRVTDTVITYTFLHCHPV